MLETSFIYNFNSIANGNGFGVKILDVKCRLDPSGGSKGGGAKDASPLGSEFCQFHAGGELGKIVSWRPPPGLVPPPLRNPGSATGSCETYTLFTRGRSRIPRRRGRQLSSRGHQHTNLANFPKKLHEIKKILVCRGVCAGRCLGSATVYFVWSWSRKFPVKWPYKVRGG